MSLPYIYRNDRIGVPPPYRFFKTNPKLNKYWRSKLNKFENLITDFFGNIDEKPFEDTIAIIECLDMVISVCTSVAHISATMNKITYIIIPHVPNFRWGLKGFKTIWYDNVKLYRQKKMNNWNSVINDLKKDLIKKYKI